MMKTRLDHIVIGAATLAQGVEYVQQELGVDIPKGGEHVTMGTHNHLMQLGNDAFLEVIAINPDAKPPSRPRWYGLDDPAVRASLVANPRLLTWVVNNDALPEIQQQCGVDLGVITPLSRNGLDWLFAVPEDGRLLAGGMLPHVMQWQTDAHPSRNMANVQCRLTAINIYHPYPAWLSAILDGLLASELVEVHALDSGEAAYLCAEIETPNGAVVLSSAPISL